MDQSSFYSTAYETNAGSMGWRWYCVRTVVVTNTRVILLLPTEKSRETCLQRGMNGWEWQKIQENSWKGVPGVNTYDFSLTVGKGKM